MSRSASWWKGVALFYALSGFASLAYEVLWSRMLSMQFGVSIFGVVLTVAAFMAGLGAGSLAGAKADVRRPLFIFAWLEIAIAIYALLLPFMQQGVSHALEGMAVGLTTWYLLQGAEALILLLIPATAMGLGFALVLKSVSNTPLSLGRLYGLNTIGGALGALFPLWSLPALGWINSVRLVALLGLAVGAAALYISQSAGDSGKAVAKRPPLSVLLKYAGIGAGSLMLEVGWVRLYGMIMLRTEYVLGVILAVFLVGIALGSLLVSRARKLSMLMPFVAGCGVLLGMWLLPHASAWVEASQFQSFSGAVFYQALLVALFTLPVTLVLGAWLPLLAERYPEAGGMWLYGANCIGGAAGALLACLVVIPFFGSAAMVVIAGLAIAALGLLWERSVWVWPGYALMLLIAWPLKGMPPVHELLPKAEANSRDLYRYEDAVSLTQVVQHLDGQRVLLTDLQRMDASSDPAAVQIQMDQARLALLLHPDPKSALFLGVGTGISIAGSMPFLNLQRSAVELSQGSIEAARIWFDKVNGNVAQSTEIHRDDARHFLSATDRKYDVIIGDLFHPDLAGMGSLLSIQQFARAKQHLNENGVFVQWLALNQFDAKSLQVVLNSFKRVFPDGQMYMDGMHLALAGSNRGLLPAAAMINNIHRLPDAVQATGGEGIWTWLGRYWGPVPDDGGAVQDEWLPHVEYSLPRARYDGNVRLDKLLDWMLRIRPDAEEAMRQLGVEQQDRRDFGSAYVATELSARSWMLALQGDEGRSVRLTWLAYQANPQDRWIASALADSMMQSLPQAKSRGLSERDALTRILKICPDCTAALRALWHLEKFEGNLQQAEAYRLRLLALSPYDSEANGAS